MSNAIEIIIKAIDKASGELKKTKGSLDDLSKSEQLMAKAFGMGTAETKQFLAVAGTTVGVVGAAAYAIKKCVDQTQQYNLEMTDLARKMGTTTEEASKLVQVADDVRLSQETLSTAMNFAIKNGISPTIEGLAKAADEYNMLAGPMAKGQYLLTNFGRSGMEMGKLLEKGGDGIRNMAEAIDDSLIVTQKAAEASKAYYQELDNLNDEITAIKMNIGNEFIPAIVNMMKNWRYTGEEMKKTKGPMTEAAVWSARIAAAQRVAAEATNSSANAFWGQAYAIEKAARAADGLESKTVDIVIRTTFITQDFGLSTSANDPRKGRGAKGGAMTYADYLNQNQQVNPPAPATGGGNIPPVVDKSKKQKKKAAGGLVAAGMPYIVGERGEELFIPTTSGEIVKNDDLQTAGGTVNFYGNVTFQIPNQQTMSQWMKEMAKL